MLIPTRTPFLPATAAFRSGNDSPRAFLERCIQLIEAHEPEVRAFVVTNLAAARAAADRSTERWRAGNPLSPIDGMPIGIKDTMDTFDMPTAQGSPLFAGHQTRTDAAPVIALREAGAVIVGKTVTTEFAALAPGPTRNPWDLSRTPGGSSSGSAAAVGAGMLTAATGSQVIGSILRPSSYCGCYGFKPSYGGINRGGCNDAMSQSCVGVLAATLAEAWVVARTISARAGGDPGYPGVSGQMSMPEAEPPHRVALLQTEGWARASESAKTGLKTVARKLAASGIEVIARSGSPAIERLESDLADAAELSLNIGNFERRWPLNTYAQHLDREKLSKHMQGVLAKAEKVTQEEYASWLATRAQIRARYNEVRESCDVCMTLSAPGAAPVGLATGDYALVVPGSLLGVPTVSLPVLQSEGLPLGLQVLGFQNADVDLFAAAAAIEAMVLGFTQK